MRTLHTQTQVVAALNYAVRKDNEATAGIAVDTALYGNNFRDVLFVIHTGTIADGTHTVTVEESSVSNDEFTAVESWRVQGALPAIVAANDNAVFQFGVRPTKRYVRIVVTDASSTDGGAIGAVALLGSGGNNPVARS